MNTEVHERNVQSRKRVDLSSDFQILHVRIRISFVIIKTTDFLDVILCIHTYGLVAMVSGNSFCPVGVAEKAIR